MRKFTYLFASLCVLSPHLWDATITVNSTADCGIGILRATMTSAVSGDTINSFLPASSTITLTSDDLPAINVPLTIGSTVANLTISRNNSSCIFFVNYTGVTIQNVVLNDANATGGTGGTSPTSSSSISAGSGSVGASGSAGASSDSFVSILSMNKKALILILWAFPSRPIIVSLRASPLASPQDIVTDLDWMESAGSGTLHSVFAGLYSDWLDKPLLAKEALLSKELVALNILRKRGFCPTL